MPLVVDVEPVVDGMVLQVGDVPGDVNGSHNLGKPNGTGAGRPMPRGGSASR